jgi:hypothetical protein
MRQPSFNEQPRVLLRDIAMITSTDLTDAEWQSLCELRYGPLKRRIPQEHWPKLINLGLAKRVCSGIVVTDEGRRYRRDRRGRNAGGPSSGGKTPVALRLVGAPTRRPLPEHEP